MRANVRGWHLLGYQDGFGDLRTASTHDTNKEKAFWATATDFNGRQIRVPQSVVRLAKAPPSRIRLHMANDLAINFIFGCEFAGYGMDESRIY